MRPVLVVLRANDLDSAIELVNANPYANGVAIFTQSGAAARRFQHDIDGGDKSCSLSGCTNEGSKTCGACGMARYCCVEHQQLDWTKGGHMRTCGKNKVSKRWPWKLDKYYAGVPGQPCGRGVVPFEDPSL